MNLQMEVEHYIKGKGVKKMHIANAVGMTASDFSLWLHYKQIISSDREKKIREFISSN